MRKINIGIIGCGAISGIYFKAGQAFENLNIVAASDLLMEKARQQAQEHRVPKVCSVDELLADPGIEIVVNLTIPKAHAAVGLAAVRAGKHVYAEKPLAVTREDGRHLMEAAGRRNLRVGSAPDTFLGGGIQTCIRLIDDGKIGRPLAATAFMMGHGPEGWHPNPEFYYETGGGPMFDMGPYYLTALVAMMGPIRRASGATGKGFAERVITTKEKYGKRIKVEVPTHVVGLLDFHNGAVGTIITSFDVWGAELPRIEIYGTEGSLSVPDPNRFGGVIKIKRAGMKEWEEVAMTHGYSENSRGIGVADMANAIQSGRPHRACGELAYHVLDTMCAIHEAADQGRRIDLSSTCARPAPLPMGLRQGTLDP